MKRRWRLNSLIQSAHIFDELNELTLARFLLSLHCDQAKSGEQHRLGRIVGRQIAKPWPTQLATYQLLLPIEESTQGITGMAVVYA
jgi:hypothetical protein